VVTVTALINDKKGEKHYTQSVNTKCCNMHKMCDQITCNQHGLVFDMFIATAISVT